jgi:hypothetical protein
MFQLKGTVYEGGIRVPFFLRSPGRFAAGRRVLQPAAHIDVTPTLLDLCGVTKPAKVKFDGVSLLPLLKGEQERLADRTLFFQWHRGDVPEVYRAFAACTGRYKLVQPAGQSDSEWSPTFKLFDLQHDPLESEDLAADKPEIVAQLKQAYEAWFKNVTAGRNYAQPARIVLGAPQENPVRLTRQDWRGPQAGWTPRSAGHWEVHIARAGIYNIVARLNKSSQPATLHFKLGNLARLQNVTADATEGGFAALRLPRGVGQLECYIEQGGAKVGVLDVTVKRLK